MAIKNNVRNAALLFLALTGVLSSFSCATAPPPQPAAATQLNPNLVDPRTGFTGGSPASEKRFAQAWGSYLQGDAAAAERRFTALEQRDPAYAPATLGRAALAIDRGDLDQATQLIDRAAGGSVTYTAAEIYRAEVAYLRNDFDRALQLYEAVVRLPDAPATARARYEALRKAKFESLVTAGRTAPTPEEAAAQLRSALTLIPDSEAARMLLVQKLIAAARFDEARKELEPLLEHADRADVQEALADIDVGHGRYQEAIVRLERLQRRSNDPRYAARLTQVKAQWAAANMPPQYQIAASSLALTRADLAVLIYWHVNAVRFAQNLAEPPIAVDIGDVAGRDELVRILAMRIYGVDPVTRTADPRRIVTAAAFTRIASRLMTLAGTPACAQPAAAEPNDLLRAQKMLEGCGVPLGDLKLVPDAPVSGAAAIAILDRISAEMSAEKR